jgi:hypothetical protein
MKAYRRGCPEFNDGLEGVGITARSLTGGGLSTTTL